MDCQKIKFLCENEEIEECCEKKLRANTWTLIRANDNLDAINKSFIDEEPIDLKIMTKTTDIIDNQIEVINDNLEAIFIDGQKWVLQEKH